MSIEELPGLISQLNECMALLGTVENKALTVRAEVGHVEGDLRELEYIFYRLSSLLQRMGLPKEVNDVIEKIQKMILVARIAHSALILLESSTPYGLIIGIITGAGAILTYMEVAQS